MITFHSVSHFSYFQLFSHLRLSQKFCYTRIANDGKDTLRKGKCDSRFIMYNVSHTLIDTCSASTFQLLYCSNFSLFNHVILLSYSNSIVTLLTLSYKHNQKSYIFHKLYSNILKINK